MSERQTIRGTARERSDFRTLRDAIRGGDPDVLLGFYADAAELRVVDPTLPRAFELKGRAEIGKYLRAVRDGGASRVLKGGAVYGGKGIAFVEECDYPDEASISVETMLEVEGGLVVRQTDLVRRARHDDGSER